MNKTFTQKLIVPTLIFSSVVLAANVPLATANAQMFNTQSPLSGSLTQLKQQINTAIDSNIAKLKASQEALKISFSADKDGITSSGSSAAGSYSYNVTKDGATGEVKSSKGSSASGTVSKDGASGQASSSSGSTASGSINKEGVTKDIKIGTGLITGLLSIPKKLIEKLQAVNQKSIEKLTEIKEKVNVQGQLAEVQATAKEYQQQIQDFAVANVQATVTKAIDSQTRVLDRLQLVANNLQTQINKIKQCVAEGSVNAQAGNGSASVNTSAPGCSELNVALNSGDAAATLQTKLDQVKANMQTIRSFLASSINLVAELNADENGTIASFQGISSQLDIVANLSAVIQNDLLNLSTSVTKQ